jgi:hypothetical protein
VTTGGSVVDESDEERSDEERSDEERSDSEVKSSEDDELSVSVVAIATAGVGELEPECV